MNSFNNTIISIMGDTTPADIPAAIRSDLEQRTTNAMVEAMALLKQPRIHYPDELAPRADLIQGCPIAALPIDLFEISEAGDKVVLKKGQSPSKALQTILNPTSPPISMDCLVAIQVCSYYVLMQILGEKQFDDLCAVHPHYDLQFTNTDPRGAPRYLRMQTPQLFMPSEIQKGDIVRFNGVPSYLEKYPMGYWQGVNTLCTKEGIDPLFDAHGFEHPINEKAICKLLTDAMQEPGTAHRVQGRALRGLRWNIPKLWHLMQAFAEK